MTLRRLLILGGISELLYLTLHTPAAAGERVIIFIVVNALAFLPFFMLVREALRKPPGFDIDRKTIRTIVFFGILFRLTLVPLAPVASDDIYRYVWDGKVALAGHNPFALPPNDPQLTSLHSDVLPSRINFPEMRTIYPPLAQLFFLASNLLFGDSVSGMKLLLVICELCTMILLYLLLNHLTLNPARIVLYAWCPLPIMYVGLDGHIDALGIPLLLLSLYLILTNKTIRGACALGLAGLAKLYPLFLVLMLLRVQKGTKAAVLVGLPLLLFVVGCWLYYEPTDGLVESLKVFNTQFEFNGSVFSVINLLVNHNTTSHLVCGVLFIAWIILVASLRQPLLEKVFLAFLGFAILSPVVHPWYLTWLAALIVLRWSAAAFALLVLSNLSNIVVYHYTATGVWQDEPLIVLLEYVPFYGLLGWALVRKRYPVPQPRAVQP
jgi:hypothetical protein